MAPREIRTSSEDVICGVCGRTLLRGEHADTWLDGGNRRQVCDLCTVRARHEGWVREGARLEQTDRRPAADRRRGLRTLVRDWRERPRSELARGGAERVNGRRNEREPLDEPVEERTALADDLAAGGVLEPPAPRRRERPAPTPPAAVPAPDPADPRLTRDVHAVPSSSAGKVAEALRAFNESEHTKTVAGVARSLGAPEVTARAEDGASVAVAVAWELCWYRYEIDLSADPPAVRRAGQGYELDELSPEERAHNAVADERGELRAAGGDLG